MNLLGNNELKEQQKLNNLELAINREKQKMEKRLTRQKILLGAFFTDALEKEAVEGLGKYTAETLPKYLTRKADRDLLRGLVENLGGTMPTDEKEQEQQQVVQDDF